MVLVDLLLMSALIAAKHFDSLKPDEDEEDSEKLQTLLWQDHRSVIRRNESEVGSGCGRVRIILLKDPIGFAVSEDRTKDLDPDPDDEKLVQSR